MNVYLIKDFDDTFVPGVWMSEEDAQANLRDGQVVKMATVVDGTVSK